MRKGRRQRTAKCKHCRKPIKVAAKGRIPTYCGQTCRQRAYERRKHRGPLFALIEDVHATKLREMIRTEVRKFMEGIGVVDNTPSPEPAAKTPNLRLISSNPIQPEPLITDHVSSDPEEDAS